MASSTAGGKKGTWGFFPGIVNVLKVFPEASTQQKGLILSMLLVNCALISVSLFNTGLSSVVVGFMYLVDVIATGGGALYLLSTTPPSWIVCRHVPSYPIETGLRHDLSQGLREIQEDAVNALKASGIAIPAAKVRANIFLLAQVRGGKADGRWRLVLHPDLSVNMTHMPELDLQFEIGQGATGLAYRDGGYILTKRLKSPKGDWERKFKMTPDLDKRIHRDLKWIVSMPLVMKDTYDAVGVLNIDGLVEINDEDILHNIAMVVKEKVDIIAETVALEPYSCIGMDRLGAI
jgi:hypothetical protein